MLCLGIETSCDETALALVGQGRLVDAVMASQADTHNLFGGVVPELASREHYRYIGALYDLLMQRNNLNLRDIGLISVARGPGLLGCLLVGIAFAKGLALGGNIPLIGVNHLHAHFLAANLETKLSFPALGLLVSGGHTHLYRINSPTDFAILGRTLDDAAGEACDKLAKMLGMPYPGGALLDRLAKGHTADIHLFPRPYINSNNLDFSFSGLKTAAAAYLTKHTNLIEMGNAVRRDGESAATQALGEVCASYLTAVADTLAHKVNKALSMWQGGKPAALIVAGGVAANSYVRGFIGQIAEDQKIPLILPSSALCTDNGAMIAHAGELAFQAGYWHDLSLSAIPRGRPIPDDMLTRSAIH
jgi:N6-L-threonylcarbamoyladenine synthase